jgi:hypothetical protein
MRALVTSCGNKSNSNRSSSTLECFSTCGIDINTTTTRRFSELRHYIYREVTPEMYIFVYTIEEKLSWLSDPCLLFTHTQYSFAFRQKSDAPNHSPCCAACGRCICARCLIRRPQTSSSCTRVNGNENVCGYKAVAVCLCVYTQSVFFSIFFCALPVWRSS